MSELTADLFVSLDGFAGGVDVGPYFGYGGPELDEWIQTEIDKPQVVVFGRVTYEVLAPMATRGSDPASQRLTAVPKLVVSSTLSEPLEWANTRLVAGDAVEVFPAVKADSDVPLRTMRSISLVRNLSTAGLVDRLRLMVFPLTCGSNGRERIFGEGTPQRMELDRTKVLDGRVVLLEYRRSA
ncbi:MAG TPA: dihydrofolate reductase family protein [Solirubrobacteraceae bacterium]